MRKFSCDGLGRIDKQNKRKRLDAKLQDKGGSSNVYESGANYRREREGRKKRKKKNQNGTTNPGELETMFTFI